MKRRRSDCGKLGNQIIRQMKAIHIINDEY